MSIMHMLRPEARAFRPDPISYRCRRYGLLTGVANRIRAIPLGQGSNGRGPEGGDARAEPPHPYPRGPRRSAHLLHSLSRPDPRDRLATIIKKRFRTLVQTPFTMLTATIMEDQHLNLLTGRAAGTQLTRVTFSRYFTERH